MSPPLPQQDLALQAPLALHHLAGRHFLLLLGVVFHFFGNLVALKTVISTYEVIAHMVSVVNHREAAVKPTEKGVPSL